MKKIYQEGHVQLCSKEWEEFRWCIKAVAGDKLAKERLLVRKRNLVHSLDGMPWEYKKAYLKHLASEQRLPKKYMHLINDDQVDQS